MPGMTMVFFTAIDTPLFSTQWQPTTAGSYAGTCIFLVVLSIILRLLYAVKCTLEAHWLDRARRRRYIVTASNQPEGAAYTDDEDAWKTTSETGTLTTKGVREDIKIVESHNARERLVQPWRLSVDLPRAILSTVMVGVGYLL